MSPLPSDLPPTPPPPPKATRESVLHLGGHPLPPLIELPSTSGGYVDLFLLSLTRPILLFIYPRALAPGEREDEEWNAIPGARGCSEHLSSVGDQIERLQSHEPDLAIFGLSTQSNERQKGIVDHLRLPFPLLSDDEGKLQRALDLPAFAWQGVSFLARTTLLLRDGQVTQYQFPVFPPTQAAQEALKMLDAGKPIASATTPPATGERMTSDTAYLEERVVNLLENIKEIEATQPLSTTTMPTPRDLIGSFRDFRGLGRATSLSSFPSSMKDASADWRNSLVAVDNETGEVVGLLAHNVTLSQQRRLHAVKRATSDEDEVDEIPTPPSATHTIRAQSTYFDRSTMGMTSSKRQFSQEPLPLSTHIAAHTYHDPDVRPASREGSVLGEDTFAPPPIPDKPGFLRSNETRNGVRKSVRSSTASVPFHTANEMMTDTDATDDKDEGSDGEAIDGLVRTRAKHVDVHRPDLLRDHRTMIASDHDDCASDASGSIVGGPVVQLWRKARGGKEGEARRKAKKEAKAAAQSENERIGRLTDARRRASPSRTSDASVRTSKAETALEGDVESAGEEETIISDPTILLAPSPETVKAARAQRIRRDRLATSAVRSIEDRLWQSALENGSLPIDAPYTHLAAMALGSSAKERSKQVPDDESNAVTDGEESGLEMAAKGERPRKKAAKPQQEPLAGPILQGSSVLIEFLAGSRIAASIIHDAATNLLATSNEETSPSEALIARQAGPDAFTPTDLRSIPQTGALRYIPVLPSHLLWFFGLGGEVTSAEAKGTYTSSAASTALHGRAKDISYVSQISQSSVVTMGSDLARLTSHAPTFLFDVATRSASSAWTSVANFTAGAGLWLGSTVHQYIVGSTNGAHMDDEEDTDDFLDNSQPGDEDADEFESIAPGGRNGSLNRTPRPVYRRKRPVPSLSGGFQVRQKSENGETNDDEMINRSSSRYSIVHFDQDGFGRHAVLQAAE